MVRIEMRWESDWPSGGRAGTCCKDLLQVAVLHSTQRPGGFPALDASSRFKQQLPSVSANRGRGFETRGTITGLATYAIL